MALEECDGTCNGSDTSLILSDWSGMNELVSITWSRVASHSFSEIAPLPQTDMEWLICVFCKELQNLLSDLMT